MQYVLLRLEKQQNSSKAKDSSFTAKCQRQDVGTTDILTKKWI